MNDIILLKDRPELIDKAAQWFCGKWGIPVRTYAESMESSIKAENGVPSWYIMTDGGNIIAGLGVIKNDFHRRPELAPNICAVYVEEKYRGRGDSKGYAGQGFGGYVPLRDKMRVSYHGAYRLL